VATIQSVIDYVDEVIPNKINSTTKLKFVSDLVGRGSEFYKFNYALATYEFKASSSSAEYNLPAGVNAMDIVYVGVSGTTYNSTNLTKSTTPFTEYKYVGIDDLTAGKTGWSDYTSQITFGSKFDNSYQAKIVYKPYYGGYTASSDTTTILDVDTPLIEYLQAKVAAKVCKSMAFPRIDLANNYELEANEKLAKARTNYFRYKRKTSRQNISYRDWW
jgi:hypothetical protein